MNSANRLRQAAEYAKESFTNYTILVSKYILVKYRLDSSELRMEFYLDFLFEFCRPGDRFLGIYSRSKCLAATKVG